MYTINKIVGYFISPMGFSIALVAAAIVIWMLGRRKLVKWAVALALVNLWLWSAPWTSRWMGVALEREFLYEGRMPTVESLPQADLIKLHGGGMGQATNVSSYAEMWSGADRVWHAARLWKAGKAPRVLVTCDADIPLLLDLGVPCSAINNESTARNTEEEVRFIENELKPLKSGQRKVRILVVTSAWHMKRTMLMYAKYAPSVEAIPAPCDFENTFGAGRAWSWMCVLPDPLAFSANSIAFHEWLGYWGYKLLR